MERLQNIFRQFYPAFQKRHALCVRQLRAAENIMRCRTAALGGHIESCPNGHMLKAHYNSCKHRSCSLCNGLPKERWLQSQKARLLNCPHYHMVFTLPHELIPLWQYNRHLFMNLMFQSTHKALSTLLSDHKYLGATPGMLMSFHSWGRNLSLHPHIHCLITDGGLNADDQWCKPRRSHFLPARVLMTIFRGIMRHALHQALEGGDLKLPEETTSALWHKRIKQSKAKAWHVSIRERYDHGRGVITYLARYVRGGPLSDQQLTLNDSAVQLNYYSHQRKRHDKMSFTPDHFLHQFLEHVPPKGSQVVRGYGLYANGKTKTLNTARELHHQAPVKKPAILLWQQWVTTLSGRDMTLCDQCHEQLQIIKVLPRQHSPPGRSEISIH